MYCTDCGTDLPGDSRFCDQCGVPCEVGARAITVPVETEAPSMKRWVKPVVLVAAAGAVLLILAAAGGAFSAPLSNFNWQALLWFVPLAIGGIVAGLNKDRINDITEAIEARLRQWQRKTAGREGFLFRFVLNPLLWTVVKFFDWTDGFTHRGIKNGTRVAITLYLVAMWLMLLYSAIVIALVIAAIVAGIAVIGLLLSMTDGDKETSSSGRASPEPERARGRPGTGRSREAQTIFGDKYTEHRDEDGDVVGRSRERSTIFGDRYAEHRDADEDVTGTSRDQETIFGDAYTEHRDEDGNVIGRSRQVKTIFGEEYTEHRDKDGNVVGESRARETIFGDKYTENKKRE